MNVVAWDKVARLLEVGNQLADATKDQGLADEWDEARYALAPEQRLARQEEAPS